jgi:hypothetical protein
VSLHAALRNGTKSVFLRFEEALDAPFGGEDNPLRHLGALGLYLLWITVGSGLYLYAVLDTGIDAVYRSIGYLSSEQWYLGGILRSLHRYASDGFMLLMLLHLVREWSYGRYHGFRLYSWMTGVPLIWLAYIAGIGGYWIVWDQLAQLSATATTELLDWLPIFSEPSARNFMAPDSINDRFFTMLVFLHLGVPLLLILGLWAHVHRISHVDYLPSRRAMLGTLAALLVLSLLKPALSNPPANLATVPGASRLRLVHPVHSSTDRPQLAGAHLDAAVRPDGTALRPARSASPRSHSRSPPSMPPTVPVAIAASPTALMPRSACSRTLGGQVGNWLSSMPTSARLAESAPALALPRRPSADRRRCSPASTCRSSRSMRCASSSSRHWHGSTGRTGSSSSVARAAPMPAPWPPPTRR